VASDIDRDMGPQPIAEVMAKLGLKSHDLVAASTEQLTHKMVSKACKGRRLTPHIQSKILRAINAATGRSYRMAELFNY
jgi:hypothetical protein